MSYDYRNGNDDDNNDREEDFGNGNDDHVDNHDQYPVDDDYDKSGTGKMDSPGNSDKKDFDDDFFKDEDFEFADYSGDDVGKRATGVNGSVREGREENSSIPL